nr:MraY family glycosyltransferase [Sulfurimonas sp. SAG-AH-194-C21]
MLTVFISIFILSFVFILLLIKYSEFLGLQDIPNARSAHKKIIPRSAGVGFVSSVLISLLIFNPDHIFTSYCIYLSIFAIMLVGLFDDRFSLSHRYKFIALFVVGIYIALHGVLINSLGTYFGYDLTMPIWIATIFTVFAIIGFSNALNLMDGLDGLAGGLSLIMLLTFFSIGYMHNDELIMTLSLVFIVTISVFLYFNWYPAQIFMGDSGSLTLGFVISVLSIKSLAYMTPSAVLFIVALPLIDTFIVMRRRIQRGQSPFKADKNHIHHFMYKTKVNVKVSVKLLIYIQLALSVIGYQLRNENQILSLVLFFLLMYVFLNLFDQRFRYRVPKKKEKLTSIRKVFKKSTKEKL